MQRLATLAAALVSATLAAGMILGAPDARADAEVYGACREGERAIVAAELPDTVDLDRCPVQGRIITDGEVGSVLPDPGEGVYAEVLTTSGAQELEIFRSRDGALELDHVGDDSQGTTAEPAFDAARRSGACSQRDFTDGEGRVEEILPWYFNRSTAPNELTADSAENAIRRAGINITSTRDSCRLADRVPAKVGLSYAGNTRSHATISQRYCLDEDGTSTVSFGDLADGILAATCNWKDLKVGDYKPIEESDIKINKTDFNWTTRPDAKSCRRRFDLEGVMTHERGHTFGLGHVLEKTDGALTMSTFINGSCQGAERTLGRGDVRGLRVKYESF